MRSVATVSKSNDNRLIPLVHALAAIIEADDYARVIKETQARDSNQPKHVAA